MGDMGTICAAPVKATGAGAGVTTGGGAMACGVTTGGATGAGAVTGGGADGAGALR